MSTVPTLFSQVKLGRNYELFIETDSGPGLFIGPPFTIEFDITRQTLASANVCQIRLYNLSEVNRNQIYFNALDQSNYRQIILKAGYGKNLNVIFTGNISAAWSVREGTNFISTIECYDGGFAFVNGTVNIPFVAGTPLKIVIETLIASLKPMGIDRGAVGNFLGVLSRGNTYSGNPAQILFELTGGAFFIDNGKAYALQSDEYVLPTGLSDLSEPVVIINDSTGLLNTPTLQQTVARFEMLFEPSLNCGRLVVVASLTFPKLNGAYKITAVKHRGIISEVVSGSLTTIGEFQNNKISIPVVGL